MAIKKTTEKDDLLFSLRGFDVRQKRTYEVRNKKDETAPSALIEIGATKIPTADGGDSFQFPFHRIGGGVDGVWDTGFYEESPCYQNYPAEERKEMVKRAKAVLANYRAATGIAYMFDHSTEEGRATIENTWFHVKAQDVFISDNPIQVMTLYVSLLTAHLADKDNEDDPQFNNASYSVVDITKLATDADEKADMGFEVIELFSTNLKTPAGKERLINILNFIGIQTADNISDAGLRQVAMNRVANSSDIYKRLKERLKNADTEKGGLLLEVYAKLRELDGKGLGLTKELKKGYYYKGTPVGQDLRKSAENIANNTDLQHVLHDLLGVEE